MSDADETKPDLTVGAIFGKPARPLTPEERGAVAALREVLTHLSSQGSIALARTHHAVKGTSTHSHFEGTRLAYEEAAEAVKKHIRSIEVVTTGGRAR